MSTYLFTIGQNLTMKQRMLLRGVIGPVLPVGKRVYRTSEGVVQVENNDQLEARKIPLT